MKQFFTVVIIIISGFCASAQHRQFQKLYSTTGPTNQGVAVIEQGNGDIIMCGVRSVPIGSGQYIANILLVRTDKHGDTIWTKELGTQSDRELSLAMEQLPGSDLIIVGSINVPPNAATMDALVIRCDTSGSVIWQKQYGGPFQDYATGVAIDNSHIVVCGVTSPDTSANTDVWLLKLDMNGDTLWTRSFGDTVLDEATDIATVNGEYYISGSTYLYTGNGPHLDSRLLKIDANGNELWSRTYGVTDRLDIARSIEPAIYNGVVDGLVFTGITNVEYTQSGVLYGDLQLVKIDTSGNVIWSKPINGSPYRREGTDIKQLSNEDFIITGFELNATIQSQELYVAKVSNTGTLIWDTAYSTFDSSYASFSVGVCQDGGWLVTGAVFTPSQPVRYVFLAKFLPHNLNVQSVPDNIYNVDIYPNPTQSHFTVKTDLDIDGNKLRLINIDGKVVYEAIYTSGNMINVTAIPKGHYIVELRTTSGIIREKLWIK